MDLGGEFWPYQSYLFQLGQKLTLGPLCKASYQGEGGQSDTQGLNVTNVSDPKSAELSGRILLALGGL